MPTRPCHHPLATALDDPPSGDVPVRVIQPRPGPLDDPRPAGAVVHTSTPHPTTAGGPAPGVEPAPVRSRTPSSAPRPAPRAAAEDGSVATEYGLLAVVAATIVSVLLEWATSGGISALLGSILARVSDLVGL